MDFTINAFIDMQRNVAGRGFNGFQRRLANITKLNFSRLDRAKVTVKLMQTCKRAPEGSARAVCALDREYR